MTLEIEAYGASDIGNIRQKNEDIFKILESKYLFSIADGMGGHKAGDIAAKEATNHMCNLLSHTLNHNISKQQVITHIDLAIKDTNNRIYNLSKINEQLLGMGTTLCLLYLHIDTAIFAHIGDSRIYHFTNNSLTQLTKDHSLINKLKAQNKSFDETNCKNIITKAIGTFPKIDPSIDSVVFSKGDTFFMCTDGLTDYVDNNALEQIIKKRLHPKNICEALIKEAKAKGSCDNITVLAIQILNL